MSVNIGQVSSAMGTGTSAVSAIGTAADTSAAATEAGTGIAGAAMGATANPGTQAEQQGYQAP